MKGNRNLLIGLFIATMACCSTNAHAQEMKPVALPKPQTDGGRPLMQVLNDRQSLRTFSDRKLPLQILSNLLWAAFGVNRSESGKRTAPSARNWQELRVYAAMEDGLYLYDAQAQALVPVLKEDIRAQTGIQPFAATVPLNLVYVADYSKMGDVAKEDKDLYSAADTGFIAQNVYLFCASEGLATVVRGALDRQALARVMKLDPDQKVILAQSVGYPGE